MSPPITIATWNVNGIRARLDRVLDWLSRTQVDVLCLQETKTPDDKFPTEDFESIDYSVAAHGQKSYNGVAVIARHDLEEVTVRIDDEDDDQARLIAATVSGVRVFSAYFPNGQSVGSDKYAYKLRWMARLRDRLEQELAAGREVALLGDFNVAPEPRDTHDPDLWEGGILCSDQEREALARLRELGLHDALRAVRPDDVVYTWWDYRLLGFPKNRGLRIDHAYLTSSLVERLVSVEVDREARKGQQPSDHAPLVVTLR